MKQMSTTSTILLVFCMSCSTTSSTPDPGPSHPASAQASVPAVAGPSDLLRSHDPLPQLSTQQVPGSATEHDHDAMQRDQSSTEHDHGAMSADPDAAETEQPAHEHGQVDPAAREKDPTDAHDGHDAQDTETEPVIYACPMHPDQRSNAPANCPICGMKMKPVEVESTPTDTHDAHDTETEPIVYACPMHPDQRSNAPANCPICGMKLEPVEVKP